MLGANRFQTFRRVLLPEMMPPVLTGFGLAFARGIGEYGSVIYISGNSAREHTQVISYVIMQKLGYIDYASATAIALVMLILSFVLLLAVNIVQMKQAARTNNVEVQRENSQFVLRKEVRFYGTKEKYEIHLNSHQRSFHICYADSSPVFDSL